MNEFEKVKKEKEKLEIKMDKIVLELKSAIKAQFWHEKGYTKSATNNWIIVEEGIDFGIDAMRKIPPTTDKKS